MVEMPEPCYTLIDLFKEHVRELQKGHHSVHEAAMHTHELAKRVGGVLGLSKDGVFDFVNGKRAYTFRPEQFEQAFGILGYVSKSDWIQRSIAEWEAQNLNDLATRLATCVDSDTIIELQHMVEESRRPTFLGLVRKAAARSIEDWADAQGQPRQVQQFRPEPETEDGHPTFLDLIRNSKGRRIA